MQNLNDHLGSGISLLLSMNVSSCDSFDGHMELPRTVSDLYAAIISEDIDGDIEVEIEFSVMENPNRFFTARTYFREFDPQWTVRLFMFDDLVEHKIVATRSVRINPDTKFRYPHDRVAGAENFDKKERRPKIITRGILQYFSHALIIVITKKYVSMIDKVVDNIYSFYYIEHGCFSVCLCL